jgi:hypothetical protein
MHKPTSNVMSPISLKQISSHLVAYEDTGAGGEDVRLIQKREDFEKQVCS